MSSVISRGVYGLLFVVLGLSCFAGIYTSFSDNYGIEDTYTLPINGTNTTLLEHLTPLHADIIDSVETLTSAVNSIVAPQNPLDVLGGFLAVGFGALKLIWAIFTIPADILNIIVVFYPFPPILTTILTLGLIVGLALKILSVLTKEDI